MTSIYFVRHANPDHSWKEDRTRPLTIDGCADLIKLKSYSINKNVDLVFSSPYTRSYETVKQIADIHNLDIKVDERFRERESGSNSNNYEMFKKRWEDLNFAEKDGESIKLVQKRNIEALEEILESYNNKTIVIGTHGTALSSIINYYDNTFGMENFLEIINLMPYVIKIDFKEKILMKKTVEFYIKKEFEN